MNFIGKLEMPKTESASEKKWLRKNNIRKNPSVTKPFLRALKRSKPTNGYSRDPFLWAMLRAEAQILFTLQDPRLKTLNIQIRLLNDVFTLIKDDPNGHGGRNIYPFFIRAYSFWRSAARSWATVQLPETYCLLRAAIENAAYACRLFHGSEELYDAYFKRQENPSAHRNRFTWREAIRALEEHELDQLVDSLYQHTIDFGAHPNPAAVSSGVVELNENESIVIYQGARVKDLVSAGKVVVLAGIAILLMFQTCYSDSFLSTKAAKKLATLLATLKKKHADNAALKAENDQAQHKTQ